MKKRLFFSWRFSQSFFKILLACFLLTGMNSCTKLFNIQNPISYLPVSVTTDSAKWLDWNVLFDPGTNSMLRSQQINDIEVYITNYLSPYGYRPYFNVICCPCDSTLYNLNVLPVNGSGQSFSTPPPAPPPPGGSGNGISNVVSKNNPMVNDSTKKTDDPNNPGGGGGGKLLLSNIGVNFSKTLAILDTGLDTAYFSSSIRDLIWSAPNGTATFRNFTFSTPVLPWEYFNDDNPGRHGTGVAGIALESLGNTSTYPRIMVLKVLDNKERGSTFNVSCALSYAVQNHATLINASLGYYNFTAGSIDPVLSHYLNLCNAPGTDSIFVFAAAGNMPLPHILNNYCTTSPYPGYPGNQLVSGPSSTRLFYPACFNDNLHNVISVTSISDFAHSCYYQNYSGKYVSIGVLNTSQYCCEARIPSMHLGFEGSSFATPVASGKVMGCLLNPPAGTAPSIRQCINNVTQTNPLLNPVTVNGKYIDNRNNQ